MSDHIEMAAGLRELAAFIEKNPQLVEVLSYPLHNMLAPLYVHENPQALMADFARAGARAGAEVRKTFDDSHGGVNVAFGPVTVRVYAPREAVCERVVVGAEQVTKEVPDPDAPKITVTETVEKVEWRCTPLLVDAAPGGSS